MLAAPEAAPRIAALETALLIAEALTVVVLTRGAYYGGAGVVAGAAVGVAVGAAAVSTAYYPAPYYTAPTYCCPWAIYAGSPLPSPKAVRLQPH